MRMWMVNPKFLCGKHLIGEHGELHKFRHIFIKKQSITGRITPITQIQPMSMGIRHHQLAQEMLRRGMKHTSPYSQPDISYLSDHEQFAEVDLRISIMDLAIRCIDCHRLIKLGLMRGERL